MTKRHTVSQLYLAFKKHHVAHDIVASSLISNVCVMVAIRVVREAVLAEQTQLSAATSHIK